MSNIDERSFVMHVPNMVQRQSDVLSNANSAARYRSFSQKFNCEVEEFMSLNYDKLVSLVDGKVHKITF
jgi:predicted transcriptional regulator